MLDNVAMPSKTRRKRPQRSSPENRTLTELADTLVPFSLGDIVVDIEMAHILSYAPRFNAKDHIHQTLELMFLLQGEIRYEYKGATLTLKAGNMLFFPPNQIHRWRSTGKKMAFIGMMLNITAAHADPASIGNRLTEAWNRRKGRIAVNHDLKTAWMNLEQEVRKRRSGYSYAASMYLSLIATLFFRSLRESLPKAVEHKPEFPVVPAEKVVLAAKKYAEAYVMGSLSLPALAAAVGVSPRHLNRLFRQFEGCTVGTFIIGLKMDAAKRFLRLGDHPVKVIASMCGYSDPAYFSRIFKKNTGTSPADYA